MHGARLVGYPVYYMSRAPAAPDIGTQHLKMVDLHVKVRSTGKKQFQRGKFRIERRHSWSE